MRAHEDAVETRQALMANAAKALATGEEEMLTDRTEAVSGADAAVNHDVVVVDAPGSSGAPERCWNCRGRDRSSAACEVASLVGLIASETAIANGRGVGAKRAATVLAAGKCRGGERGLYEGIVCPVLKMAKLASSLKGTKLAETVEKAQGATPATVSAKFAAAISLYSQDRGQSPPAATSAALAPAAAASPSAGEIAAARKLAPRLSTAPFSPPLERNSGGGDSCQQRTRDVPRSTSSENLAGAEGTEVRGRLQGSSGESERRNTAATSASAQASSPSPPPHPPSSSPSSSAVHSAMADAGEASHSSAGGFHRASASSAVDSAAAAVTSWGRAATNMKVVKEEPVEATEASLGGSRGVVAAAVSSSRSIAAATVTRRSYRDSEEAGFGATAAKVNGDNLCTVRVSEHVDGSRGGGGGGLLGKGFKVYFDIAHVTVLRGMETRLDVKPRADVRYSYISSLFYNGVFCAKVGTSRVRVRVEKRACMGFPALSPHGRTHGRGVKPPLSPSPPPPPRPTPQLPEI